ncbi:hypothetical protein [Fictibacillus sp. FJAT-27399]|uniref:hypothetical protein n=1 Tax=Fictibacillus sp. FJAT-27399 TaxID=1729689 RepID=UPI00078120CF|nr:hypothetical protein [Fictibacillus sp. FJAT-27399]
MEILSPSQWLQSISAGDEILLVNPPVSEVRYAWLKWNQPSDLLLLSNKLKEVLGCKVELLDFMLPDENGRVPNKDYNLKHINGINYKTRLYGTPLDKITKNLDKMSSVWKPNHIVITSLTSYWYEPIIRIIPLFRTYFPEIKISLIGAFPTIETEEAKKIGADIIVNDFFDFTDTIQDFSIYSQETTKLLNDNKELSFGGIKYTQTNTINNIQKQINSLLESKIKNIVIFEHDIFNEDSFILNELLDYIEYNNININIHGLCGIDPSKAKGDIYQKMIRNGFRSFFLEYDATNNELNLDSYKKAYYDLVKFNPIKKIASGNLAGFLMIGTPDDELESMFRHSFNILETCGSLIPKPYTPVPGTVEYKKAINDLGLDKISPHLFPFAEINGISRTDYKDFYQHAAFLNEKRNGSAFNFFDDSHTSISLRKSLSKKVGIL